MRVLVTGGVRSGKSHHAESLLRGRVTYVACGPAYDDADWSERVAAHRARRPAAWQTVETLDVAEVLRAATGPVLIDCIGTWLTGVMDARDLWGASAGEAEAAVGGLVGEVVAALLERPDVVVVTNEVGLGVVPEHRSGRVFRDLLGSANQRIAAACDEVHLVVAGRVLRL